MPIFARPRVVQLVWQSVPAVLRGFTHWIKALRAWRSKWSDGDGPRDARIYLIRKRLRMDTERIRASQPPLENIMTILIFDAKGKNEPLCLELGELATEAQKIFSASATPLSLH